MPTLTQYQSIIDDKPIHIATVTPDHNPNLAVAADVKVLDDNHLLISVNEMIRTQENIQQNPEVVITAFDPDWKGVRIFGTAKFYESGKYYELCKDFFFTKADPAALSVTEPKGAIVVTAEKVEKYV